MDDLEAEYIENAFGWPIEKQIPVFRRLFKKRANMALVLYNKNHPDPHHTHMNFMALDVKTGLEKTFFAELCMFNDVDDGNSGFVATACEIVDGNSAGGRRINYLQRWEIPTRLL